jgi:hypothetical protein
LRIFTSWFAVLAIGVAACSGVIGETGNRGHETTGGGPTNNDGGVRPPPPVDAGGAVASDGKAPEGASVGPSPLRRLGRVEMLHTLHDLFPALPASFDANVDLPLDNDIQLAFSLPGSVSDLEVRRFMDLAEAAITTLGANAPNKTFTCTGSDQTACARDFINKFGKRAFRRPLAQVEADDLVALYTKLRTDPQMNYAFPDALGILIEAILQSPGFLYRWERGLAAPQMDGTLVKFDNYEVASRLSYYLWNSMPDDALIAAADAGNLSTPDQIAQQAARLLQDPRADETLADFITQWLELGPLSTAIKDTSVYPTFKPELKDSMRAETVALSHDVLRSAAPTFSALLTAPYTFVDANLAKYYGVTPDANGRVDLTGTARLGLLTQGAVMSVKGNSYRTSPVRRGKFVLNRLLCQTVPPPPPNVVPELPPPDPTKTIRQQMAEHRSQPSCAVCHDTMDLLGFAFEHFDGAGNYRPNDMGHPIDSSGSATIDGRVASYQDAAALAKILASSHEAHDCFTRQWMRYAIDRFEQTADAAAVNYLTTTYEGSGLDTRDLIVRITRTLPFSYRAPADGEVLIP